MTANRWRTLQFTCLTSITLHAATGADGRFRIDDLAPGVYTLAPNAPGYVLATPSMQAVSPSLRAPDYYRPGDTVTLMMERGGVITGRVTNAAGDPVVNVTVRAVRVGERAEERSSQFFNFESQRSFSLTDDRGVYRMYGLAPDRYIVAAGSGDERYSSEPSPFAGDAPTYFPSATRETATVIEVRAGEEASGTDIRYRGERGRVVSGTATRASGSDPLNAVIVTLKHRTSGITEATTYIYDRTSGFAFDGVPDGEYTVSARTDSGLRRGDESASPPRDVAVRGADVSNLQLTLAPLASIRGRIRLEALSAANRAERCSSGSRNLALEEIVVMARRVEPERERENRSQASPTQLVSVPSASGEFALRNLEAGRYRVNVLLPPEAAWYVRALNFPAIVSRGPSSQRSAQPSTTTANDEVTLGSGKRIADLSVVIAEGAASLRGRVVAASEGAALPSRLRLYLVPMEPERAEDALRYAEATIEAEGSFALRRLAPGRYRILARGVSDDESNETARRASAQRDAAFRLQLRREAEAANIVLELQPCQRVNDYVLRYGAPSSSQPSER